MNITSDNKNLIINFEYDPCLIEIIKKFNSRKFNNKDKSWRVPKIHVKNVLETLVPLGFSMDENTKSAYTEALLKKKKIARILANELKPSEQDAIKDTNLPLFNFQKIGVGFLCVAKSALLGDEPGCGKSIQTLAFTVINKLDKVLILCPATLKLSWHDEIEKWLPHKKMVVITGSKKERDKLWQTDSEPTYYLANYELLIRDIDIIKKIKWDGVITDEATRISNPKAQQSKLVKTIPAKFKIALTGTPLNNAVQDIWNILDFCQPGLLGDYWQFINRYCLKDKWGSITGYKNLNELQTFIGDNMLRRRKEDVLTELPDKLYENIYIEFTPEEKTIYNAVKNEISEKLKEYEIDKVVDDKYLSNMLVKMVRLKQVTDSVELVSEHTVSSKLSALKELLKDIMNSDTKAIVFTQFAEMATILMRELEEYKPLLIAGSVDTTDRQKNVNEFQTNSENRIMVMTEAGGFGLNLQRSNYIIHYDLPWSISKMEQREGRAHRIGQKSVLTIYNLIVSNSIDEYVLKILQKKQKMSDDILGDDEVKKKVKITHRDLQKLLS